MDREPSESEYGTGHIEEDLPEIFRQIVLQSPISTWIADRNGTNIFQNEACRRLFGIERDEQTVGRYNILKDNVLIERGVMPQIRKVFEEGGCTEVLVEYDLRKVRHVQVAGGGPRVLRGFLFAIKDERGRVRYVVVQHEDHTQRWQAEQALLRSEENFRAIFDKAPAAILAYDRSGVILQANRACERQYGFPVKQLVGRSVFETISRPEDRARTNEVTERVLSGETVENVEWRRRRADGSAIYVLTNTTPIYNAAGDVVACLSLNIDITERKMAERRRRELEAHKRQFYRRTILAATQGKLVISERHEIRRLAGPALESWQITSGEDLSPIRRAIAETASSAGMDASRVSEFVLCAGEAITNAFKHAGGGNASLHRIADRLVFVVSDTGPGIEALILPEAILAKGYSTVGSLGMGYKAIISLADRVYLATGPNGTTVAIEMKVRPSDASLSNASLPDTWAKTRG